ncbi:MAG: hypothetical protein U0T81_05770 [Saprospiraceae bacterium]
MYYRYVDTVVIRNGVSELIRILRYEEHPDSMPCGEFASSDQVRENTSLCRQCQRKNISTNMLGFTRY